MNKFLRELHDLSQEYDPWVRALAFKVLDDPRFVIWSGSDSPNKHHYGDGGLIKHTTEVINLCWNSAMTLSNVNNDVIFLAALWHDYGKIWDYIVDHNGVWHQTNHKHLIYQINRSSTEWFMAAKAENIDTEIVEQVLHCILAHHGSAGPILPQTREAWILHTCDLMSARVDEIKS